MAMGDFGTGRKNQRIIAEKMAKKAEQDPVQFVLTLGDNFYPSGVMSIRDEQWHTKFEEIYDFPSLDVPFYATLGNHDHYGNINSEIEYTKISQRWRMPKTYYTFIYPLGEKNSIQFFALDTTPWAISDVQGILARPDSLKSQDQMTWLKKELQQSSATWKIVMGHHPLYSSGKYGDNATLIYLLEPLFIRYDVNLYLSGHDHHQELVKSIRGVHYIISGAASKARNVVWRGITQYAAADLGFTWFRVSHEELVVEFISRTGNLDYAYVIRRKKA
jgi:acid phosphatase